MTVVLKNNAAFTGTLVKEDDQKIAIKMATAEMEWDKSGVKEILRFEADDNQPKTGEETKKIKLPFLQ